MNFDLPPGPYTADWDSLRNYRVPDWFKDAKFGIFIHWGLYAVPAFGNEWYPRSMYLREHAAFAHHRDTWGDQGRFGYKDFVPLFRAENWDPSAWVDLFKECGARYVVPVADHHDGFAMYATEFTDWNSAKMGPRRDVCGELEPLVRQAGMKFGVSSHRAFNWRYFTFDDAFDTTDAGNEGIYGRPHPADEPADEAFLTDWYARTRELVDRFNPDILWFDFGWHKDEFEPYRPAVCAYYYNRAVERGYEPVLQYKDKFPDGVAVLDIERGKLKGIRDGYWQTDTSVSYQSWGYVENDDFKPVSVLIHDLVDIVAKNGNLLLNVGPKPDGTIPEPAVASLKAVGKWLATNGEAIYGTRCWTRFGEGETEVVEGHMTEKQNTAFGPEDVRFTQRDGALYAILLGWPGNRAVLKSLGSTSELANRITRIDLLGGPTDLNWTQTPEGLAINLPDDPVGEHAFTLRAQIR